MNSALTEYKLIKAQELQKGAEEQAGHFLARAIKAEREAAAWKALFRDLCRYLLARTFVPDQAKATLRKMLRTETP